MKLKFKKVLGTILAFGILFSAVSCTASCGKKHSNNQGSSNIVNVSSEIIEPSSSSSSQEKYPGRFVIDAPRTVVVGDVLNLDDYIKVKNGTNWEENEFEARLTTPDTAELEGHILTITNTGDVSVAVSAGSKDGNFSTFAYSRLSFDYSNAIENVTNTYTIYELDYNDNLELEGGIWMIHNPRYVFIAGYDVTGAYTDNAIVGGGLAELRNGNVHMFNLKNDGSVDAHDKLGGQLSNYIVGLDYNLPASVFEDVKYTDALGQKIDALMVSRTGYTYSFEDQRSIFSTNLIDEFTLRINNQRVSCVPHTIWMYPMVDEIGATLWRMDI